MSSLGSVDLVRPEEPDLYIGALDEIPPLNSISQGRTPTTDSVQSRHDTSMASAISTLRKKIALLVDQAGQDWSRLGRHPSISCPSVSGPSILTSSATDVSPNFSDSHDEG